MWWDPYPQKKTRTPRKFLLPQMTSRWLRQSLPQNLQQLRRFIRGQLGQAIHLNTAFRIHTDLARMGSQSNPVQLRMKLKSIYLLGKTTSTYKCSNPSPFNLHSRALPSSSIDGPQEVNEVIVVKLLGGETLDFIPGKWTHPLKIHSWKMHFRLK